MFKFNQEERYVMPAHLGSRTDKVPSGWYHDVTKWKLERKILRDEEISKKNGLTEFLTSRIKNDPPLTGGPSLYQY